MDYKKEFYHLEQLLEQKQYFSVVTKSVSIFEFGLRKIFKDYIDRVKNPNDKKKILSIVKIVGNNVKPLENMDFNDLMELEEKLNIFFNYKKEFKIESFRLKVIDFKAFIKYKRKILLRRELIERIDAEIILLILKTFLIEYRLMEPAFTMNILCEKCGNSVPENSLVCPFCGASLQEESVFEKKPKIDKNKIIKNENADILKQFVSRISDKIEKINKNEKGYFEALFFNDSEMIYIPEQSFTMGTEADNAFPKEKPEHLVNLSAYWISKYEVTFEQYDNFCRETKNAMTNDENWGRGKMPVINVSWTEANLYCQWLSAKTGLFFRLPTEAEWEFAAKGNTNNIYPWGNEPPTDKHANFGYSLYKTSEIGSYPLGMSPFGLLDMGGNIREWCSDWYDELFYKVSPKDNPKGPIEGESRVIRGGGWGYDESFLRTTDRNRWLPEDFSSEIGFRVVLESK